MATTDADKSWYTNRKQVRDHQSWLCPQLNGCGTKHLRAPNDKATLPTHVGLPARYIEMVRRHQPQDHTAPVIERPFGVERNATVHAESERFACRSGS